MAYEQAIATVLLFGNWGKMWCIELIEYWEKWPREPIYLLSHYQLSCDQRDKFAYSKLMYIYRYIPQLLDSWAFQQNFGSDGSERQPKRLRIIQWCSAKTRGSAQKGVTGSHLTIGDRVWRNVAVVKQERTRKLSSIWHRPHTIIDRVGAVNYGIQLIGSPKTLVVSLVVHRKRLKLCYRQLTNDFNLKTYDIHVCWCCCEPNVN